MVGIQYLAGFCERFILLMDQGNEEMFESSCGLIDVADQREGWLLLVTCLSTC